MSADLLQTLDRKLQRIAHALRSGAADDPRAIERLALSLPSATDRNDDRAAGMVNAARFFYVAGQPTVGLRIADIARRYAEVHSPGEHLLDASIIAGMCAADLGDLPQAMEAYSVGLQLATATSSKVAEAKLWLNTGTALNYGGVFREATACYRHVLCIGDVEPDAAVLRPFAYAAIALSSLHLGEIAQGLTAVEKAIALSADSDEVHRVQQRALAENYYTRLLVEVGAYDAATAHARAAREYANRSKSPRSDIQASVAEGLAETFSGQADVGISRLTQALAKACELKLASREVLAALVKALEHAGRHDEALKYLREMLDQQRQTVEANVLQHVRIHLAKLHESSPDTPIEELQEAMRQVETHIEVVSDKAAMAEVERKRQAVFDARVEALERQAVAAELRDDATGEHCYRVGRLACLLAKELHCDEQTILMIDVAARLHDVGKAGIPDGILLKPGSFNAAERSIIETHADIGADILSKSLIPDIDTAVAIARHHHERWDGKGYPARIGRQEIPLAARITSLADVFDALTHKRPYKPAWSFEAALAEIISSAGTRFDPELTRTFVVLLNRLTKEHPDLDQHLGQAARAPSFIRAREQIQSLAA